MWEYLQGRTCSLFALPASICHLLLLVRTLSSFLPGSFPPHSLFWIPSGRAIILCLFSVSAWLTDSCGVRLLVGQCKSHRAWGQWWEAIWNTETSRTSFFLSGTFHNRDIDLRCRNQPLVRAQGDFFPFLFTSLHCGYKCGKPWFQHTESQPSESDSNIRPWSEAKISVKENSSIWPPVICFVRTGSF